MVATSHRKHPMNTLESHSPLLGLSQRLPPANLQAEQALLGALLANNKAYERVSEFLQPDHFADAVNVAGDQMAAEAISQAQSLLQIDRTGRIQTDGTGQRFGRDIDAEGTARRFDDGETDAVTGDRIADGDITQIEEAGVNAQANGRRAIVARCQFGNSPNGGDDSREHKKINQIEARRDAILPR